MDSIVDYCGGNFDDAHSIGKFDGEILMARRVLEQLDANKNEENKNASN